MLQSEVKKKERKRRDKRFPSRSTSKIKNRENDLVVARDRLLDLFDKPRVVLGRLLGSVLSLVGSARSSSGGCSGLSGDGRADSGTLGRLRERRKEKESDKLGICFYFFKKERLTAAPGAVELVASKL